MNQTILTGNLGADPEMFYSSDGTPIAAFNLAFRSYGEKTCWIRVSCNNRLAEVAQEYLHKGARIAVSGLLDQNKWEGEDGAQRSAFRLLANNIEFIKTDGRGFEDDESGEEETDHQPSYPEGSQAPF